LHRTDEDDYVFFKEIQKAIISVGEGVDEPLGGPNHPRLTRSTGVGRMLRRPAP
jgi:hypothetical protein